MLLKEYEIVYIVVEALCGTLGLISNFLVILVFARRSVQKPPAVILIISLAIGDFIYSLFSSSLQIAGQIYHASNRNDSATGTCIEGILSQVSIAVTVATEYYGILLHGLITINRYWVVCRTPRRSTTTFGTILYVTLVVLTSLFIGSFAGYQSSRTQPITYSQLSTIIEFDHTFLGVLFITLVGTVVLIVVLNCKMVTHVRNRQRKVLPDIHFNEGSNENAGVENENQPNAENASKRCVTTSSFVSSEWVFVPVTPSNLVKTGSHLSIPSTAQAGPLPTLSQPQQQPQLRQQQIRPIQQVQVPDNRRNFQRQTLSRMTKTLILSTTIFALLWIVTFGSVMIPPRILRQLKHSNSHAYAYVLFFSEFSRLNHFLNPVIYGFMCTRFKEEFKRMFRSD